MVRAHDAHADGVAGSAGYGAPVPAPRARLRLRAQAPADLPILFEFQCDAESNAMAGTKPRSRQAFWAAWERMASDPTVAAWVIEDVGGPTPVVVGSIARFVVDGHTAVGYWIGRPHWGRGLGTAGLGLFLARETARPLHATVVASNAASMRMLERHGFRRTGTKMGEETDRFTAQPIVEFVLE